MEFINLTPAQAGYTLGMDPSGRELLIIVVKCTLGLPDADGKVRRDHEQLPLIAADTFTGEPERSAPLRESDFAPHKKYCDILLIGRAHAPNGRPTARVPVAIAVGHWRKRLNVVGDRFWKSGVITSASNPEPFTTMLISYDTAFGGIDDWHPDLLRHRTYEQNPVGRGYHNVLNASLVDGTPLPNTEEHNRPIATPNGRYSPMALGPVGRSWLPRRALAGTYDDAWRKNHFPFLPTDFDIGYYQAAPVDQQIQPPRGGEHVSLMNLTSNGGLFFELPKIQATITIFPKDGSREDFSPHIDTVVFEPESSRYTLSWRVTRPLRRDVFDIEQVVIGRSPPGLKSAVVEAIGTDGSGSIASMSDALGIPIRSEPA